VLGFLQLGWEIAMKISLGLAICAVLASSLAASADKAEKPRFKQNGDPCTAEEIANPPLVDVRYKGQTVKWKVECRTKAEWNFERSTSAENERARKRQLDNRIYAPSYSGLSGEGANVSQSQ
jgi:hypothetical protein